MSDLSLLNLTLEEKIKHSKRLIMDWYYQFDGQVYVSYSGGKDSTVLLHLVRSLFPDVKAVFSNTGLEYPEIVKFVKNTENVEIIKPLLTFRQVIEKYGYPIISKEQSQYINQFRNAKSQHTRELRLNGNNKGQFKISEKWKFLINAPFKISEKCCQIMKKNPFKLYEKQTGLKPFIGVMASESSLRKQKFLKDECNGFKAKRPISKPIMFWSEEDIYNYIKMNNIEICSLYNFGYKRTGCMFCMYGCHLNHDTRFELMKNTHPKIYNYCMNNLKLKNVLEYIKSGNNAKQL